MTERELDTSAAYLLRRDFRRGGALTLVLVDDSLPFEALARGDVVPEEPVALRVQEARVLGDFAATAFVGLYTISPRLVRACAGFSGWATFPIRVEGPMADSLEGYRGLAVTGRCGPIDESLSTRVVRPGPDGRPAPHRLGLHPRPGLWDGSDLFVPEHSLRVCVTEPVRDVLLALGAVGVEFERMSEVAEWIWDE
jgi:hypothetical protein